MTVNSRVINSKKYIWDNKLYANENDAQNTIAKYKKTGFDTHISKEGNNFLVYTRRLAVINADKK